MIGARTGSMTWLRRTVARAMARDLPVFVVPDLNAARLQGLDVEAAGLRVVPTSRHASVLLIVGNLPDKLVPAAGVAYAQMPRPRLILTTATAGISGLPQPDVIAQPGQEGLRAAVDALRNQLATGAFSEDVPEVEIAGVKTRTEYVCPMHPEIVRDEPGSCPICGMFLVPRESAGMMDMSHADHGSNTRPAPMEHAAHGTGDGGYTCPMHPEIVQDEPGSCPICGMNLVPREPTAMAHGEMADMHGQHDVPDNDSPRYTCPMHPEIVQSEPGSCPICGMNLVLQESDTMASMPSGHQHDNTQSEPVYTCPMHPEIVQGEPGSCPICGMYLVPQEPDATMAMPTEHHGDDAPAEPVYTCPMHPEIRESVPGSCPICGMHLVLSEEPAASSSDVSGMDDMHDHAAMHHGGEDERAADATTYTCPMHPEIVRDEPGTCPICGMYLVPREPDETTTDASDHQGHDMPPASTPRYTCPMHPEIVRDEPGSCPICGMFLVPMDEPADPHADHTGHAMDAMSDDDPGATHTMHMGHGAAPMAENDGASAMMAMDHGSHTMESASGTMSHGNGMMDHSGGMMDHSGHGGGFMSMVAITKDLPRSRDGLPMDWIETPFGPFFPGLPGGLRLALTLDGDTVAKATLMSGATTRGIDASIPGPAASLPARVADLACLAPGAWGIVGQQAVHPNVDDATRRARLARLEHARIVSHLGWLASFATLLGHSVLARRAAEAQADAVRVSSGESLDRLDDRIRALVTLIDRTPLLAHRLEGIGQIGHEHHQHLRGPVARAAGIASDARRDDPTYATVPFEPTTRDGGDALARLRVRLAEIEQSMQLIRAAGGVVGVLDEPPGDEYEPGGAEMELPRGRGMLHLMGAGGIVDGAHIDTPSSALAELIPTVAEGAEVADALLAIASLDLSPWEIDR